MQAGDAEHGLVHAVALEAAVAEDPPVLQPGQGVLHPGSRPAVDGILRLLLRAEVRLTASFAVRDEQAGAPVSAVGDGRCAATGPVDAGLRKGPTLVAAAGQRQADRHHQAAVGVDDDLQVRRVPVVLAGGSHTAVVGGHQGAIDDVDGVLARPAGRPARWPAEGRGDRGCGRPQTSGLRTAAPPAATSGSCANTLPPAAPGPPAAAARNGPAEHHHHDAAPTPPAWRTATRSTRRTARSTSDHLLRSPHPCQPTHQPPHQLRDNL